VRPRGSMLEGEVVMGGASLSSGLALPWLAACSAAPMGQPTALATTALASASPPSSRLTPQTSSCDVSDTWDVELTVTGGFAGVDRRLEVGDLGAYEAEDAQTASREEGVLSADETEQLLELLPSVCEPNDAARLPSCADCFNYSLQATLQGSPYELVLNDLNLPEAPVGPLVGWLSSYLNAVLQD